MKSRSITGRDPATGNILEVIIENGRIRAIIPSPIEEAPWLSPGFIDLQVNGYLGSDANADDVDPDVILALTKTMLRAGSDNISSYCHHSFRGKNHSRAAGHCRCKTRRSGRGSCHSVCACGRPVHFAE